MMSYSDPALPQVDDETFARAQDLLASRAGRTNRGANEIWLFSGQIFCDSCGNVCYSRRSNNKKGSYTYYGCGLQLGMGADRCDNRVGVREDFLMTRVQSAVAAVLEDLDGVLAEATATAQQILREKNDDAARIKGQMATVTGRSSCCLTPTSTRAPSDRSAASSARVRPSARACGPHSTAAPETRPTTPRPSSMPTARRSWKPR